MKKTILILTLLGILAGCQSENPFIPDEVAKAILKEKELKPVEYVALIVKNDVYWIRNFDQSPRKITNSPAQVKKLIRLNPDHSRIAYLNNAGAPVIIDTLGVVKEQPASFSNVKQMDWSADGKTLYMLIGNQLKFHGATIQVPEMILEVGETVLSVAITRNQDILYIVQTPTGLNRYTQRLVKRSKNGTTTAIAKQSGEIRHMNSIRLSKDGKYFTLGYTESIYDIDLVKVEVYSLDGQFPELTYETAEYIDPVYDHFSAFMVMGTRSRSVLGDYYLMAFYTLNEAMEEDKSKYKTDYVGSTGSIHIDWK